MELHLAQVEVPQQPGNPKDDDCQKPEYAGTRCDKVRDLSSVLFPQDNINVAPAVSLSKSNPPYECWREAEVEYAKPTSLAQQQPNSEFLPKCRKSTGQERAPTILLRFCCTKKLRKQMRPVPHASARAPLPEAPPPT